MDVTKVVINSYAPSTGICAEATIVLDDSLAIHKISIINGDRGLFVSMPNTGHTKIYNSKRRFEDLVHPLSKELSNKISNAVLEAYKSHQENS